MFSLPRLRFIALLLVATVFVVACGSSDSDDEADSSTTSSTTVAPPEGDDASTTATTTTAGGDINAAESTTTSATPSGPSGELASGTVTTAGNLSSEWTLSGNSDELCFRANLTHPDPETQADAGSGIDDCLRPAGGITSMEDHLSVDVGTVDGSKTIGYLWGRVESDILVLSIVHEDDSTTEIELIPGPNGMRVFAFVAEIDTLTPVKSLEAISGTKLEDTEAIRDFLRVGPTYPVVEPPPPTPTEVYPTVN